MAKQLESRVRVGGFTFEYSNNEDCKFYECRGAMMWDDDHDEMPEPALWEAAEKLQTILEADGHKNVDVCHSEKGWVEVNIG